MESIIVSVKKLQVAMWSAFTNGRELPTNLSEYVVKYTHNEYWFEFNAYRDNELVGVIKVSRDTPELKSADPLFYSPAFYAKWNHFIECLRNDFVEKQTN